MNQRDEKIEDTKGEIHNEKKLKEYSKPEITQFGAMQRFTLGGTPGFDDSGAQFTENLPV